jgi:hypothetical protein
MDFESLPTLNAAIKSAGDTLQSVLSDAMDKLDATEHAAIEQMLAGIQQAEAPVLKDIDQLDGVLLGFQQDVHTLVTNGLEAEFPGGIVVKLRVPK